MSMSHKNGADFELMRGNQFANLFRKARLANPGIDNYALLARSGSNNPAIGREVASHYSINKEHQVILA
jgi:hypothetical protein